MGRKRRLAVLLVVPLGLIACGGNSSSSSGGSTSKSFTIAFSNPVGSNDLLVVVQKAIEARAQCLGFKVVALDANLSADKQVSDITQFISQKVDGIIVEPLNASAVKPVVEQAQAAGIKVIGSNLTLGKTGTTTADIAPFQASVDEGYQQSAQETAQYLSGQLGGHGNVLGIGIGFPVPVIQYEVSALHTAAIAYGLNWLGEVDNPSDNEAGAEPIVEQALLKYPNINAIMAYNEPSALGAAAALKAQGRTGVLITAANGTPAGVDAVKTGQIAATWDLLPWKLGVDFVNVLTQLMEGHTAPVTTTVPSQKLTMNNLSSQVNWDSAVSQIASCKITS